MDFVPGLVLCRRFHDEVVGPIMRRHLPGLPYAAGRLDTGSELLGLDTARSVDHDWGPRLQVFVGPDDTHRTAEIIATVDAHLPASFLGYPTRFAGHPDPGLGGLGVLAADGDRHGVRVLGLSDWLSAALGFDPRSGVTVADWLAVPTQRLAEVTGGAVFHDDLDGALARVRTALDWYPDDVWRYVLAAQWTRIAQEEHFVGRCAEVGDELGSLVVTGRIARDLMRLCLLLRRRYPPYGKWLGSQFARLPGAAPIAADLGTALGLGVPAGITGAAAREAGLARALTAAALWSNETGLAEAMDPTVRPFHSRPFLVLDAGRFADSLRAALTDPGLRARPPVGAVDQFVDSTDVLAHADRSAAVSGALHRM
ncbi:DUF4037 domain-containing protein [Micromonospora sp. NBC_01796]|uniref:DUF4037 domain-containing protein n=1 Tax=Micromonospora sp. NBC_01796 TaxID=2975987 RepID=UPI002DD8460A|nr:DUF4037 domain-containing protein [Micromonospora sp. NBC_01796]WSA85228.1 DUF4037 domain-containing protein [Micromonospora sp. NBC_01796]